MSNCLMCLASLHASCLIESCDCNHPFHNTEGSSSRGNYPGGLSQGVIPDPLGEGSENSVAGSSNARPSEPSERMEPRRYANLRDSSSRTDKNNRTRKRQSNLADQQSTGRKRAAKLYPIDPQRDCEWSNLANCGGGKYPVLGCLRGKQQARHHGPLKSVMANEEGNVHRICHYCHNRWHTANDPSYDFNNPDTTPHSPRELTEKELRAVVLDEMRYLQDQARKRPHLIKD